MLYICEYDGTASPELLQQYAEQLPIPPYNGPLEGVKWQKRRERILAWLLFRSVVGSEKMKELDIRRTNYGKPYSEADPEFHFSISHCEHACACIISQVPCGVDVEKKFAVRDPLLRKICHPEEIAMFHLWLQDEKERQLRFLWSMKESFVKMDGRGLGYGLHSVNLASVLPIQADKNTDEIKTAEKDGVSYMAAEYEAYTLAGCVHKQTEISVRKFSEIELFGILRKE